MLEDYSDFDTESFFGSLSPSDQERINKKLHEETVKREQVQRSHLESAKIEIHAFIQEQNEINAKIKE